MKHQININFSKRNRRAVIILSIILLLIIYFPRIYFNIKSEEKISIESFPSNNWIKENKKTFNYKFDKISYYEKKNNFKFKRPNSRFNPNIYSKEDWMKLGMSEKQADVILKFAKRGLHSNDDLKKIFVISPDLFNLIKDSTFYLFENKSLKFEKFTNAEFKNTTVEINTVTEEELKQLKGIGDFFAKQIIKKRNELGGFYEKSQLLEVWKFDEQKLKDIESMFDIDQSKIFKIDLNKVNLDELKKHPYIKWNIANSILKIREQKGGFKNIDEIKESKLINEELFEKIKPYLSL